MGEAAVGGSTWTSRCNLLYCLLGIKYKQRSVLFRIWKAKTSLPNREHIFESSFSTQGNNLGESMSGTNEPRFYQKHLPP